MPWQLSYAAMAEADNAELQTDVMRFMAILAFCLVAIFAIVQSLPAAPRAEAAPVAPPVTVPPAVQTPAPAPAPVIPAPAAPVQKIRPEPKEPAPRVEPVAPTVQHPAPPVRLVRPKPKPLSPPERVPALQRAAPPTPVVTAPPVADPVPAPQTAPPAPLAASAASGPGLSLRFESDAVLRSLVERGLVSLYAIDADSFYAMRLDRGRVVFAADRAPAQYHEMIAATVPAEIRTTLARSGGPDPQSVTWGVTLPRATSQQLMRFVRTNYAGSLVITAEAGLALAGG